MFITASGFGTYFSVVISNRFLPRYSNENEFCITNTSYLFTVRYIIHLVTKPFYPRKQSLGQSVCLSKRGSLYDVTSSLADWFRVLSRGRPKGVSVQEGLCLGGLCPQQGFCPGDPSGPRTPLLVMSG